MLTAINWSVDSEIIEGWKTPNLYGLLFVGGLVTGYFIVKQIFKKENISNETKRTAEMLSKVSPGELAKAFHFSNILIKRSSVA